MRYWPDIDNPKTFNEKIAHRKLKERNSRYRVLADKWAVRDYVRVKIGDSYLNNVYAVISSISELDFESLPERFIAKPTNQSGKICFVDNKTKLSKGRFLRMVEHWLHSRYEYGIVHGEYWYADIPPKVMFEEWLSDGRYDVPPDFKFLVFHGKVYAIQTSFRFPYHRLNMYTREWQQIPVKRGKFPNENIDPKEIRPGKLEEMISIAEILGSEFDFVRVDLYYLFNSNRIVFGEMTFAPGSGYTSFIPNYYDSKFGKLW
ncbi:MAG: ATP-grasp fold amidoligase family protein [Candidatus Bathyarchaeia archaeon]